MDNTFLEKAFYWSEQNPRHIRLLNKVFARLGVPVRLKRPPHPLRDMTTLDLRVNLFHLVEQACVSAAPGDLAEFGSFTGETAALFGEVAKHHSPDRVLHLYDSFEAQYSTSEAVRPQLEANLASRGVTNFVVHEGKFRDTVPNELPERLVFVHIDCGFGGNPAEHADVVFELLEHVYPRLVPGGIIALMDYCDQARLRVELAVNPGVQLAADRFFSTRPEKVAVLLAGEAGLGYVRKL